MYEIRFNTREQILEVRYEGFWDVETARAFVAEWKRTMDRLRAERGPVPFLSDSRDFPIQSAAVLEVLAEFTTSELDHARARCAILVKGALSSLQAKRVATTDDLVQVFTDETAARSWLATPPSSAAA